MMQSSAKVTYTRRQILRIIGLGLTSIHLPVRFTSCGKEQSKIRHIVTLSFDDGFKKSSLKTAEIYEKYGLSACINVIATAHLEEFELPNDYHKWPTGDFNLWNELQARGHEIMPHGFIHANLSQTTFEKAKDLVLKCLDIFSKELIGFKPQNAVFNFPYNASSPELEEWLPLVVRAFRTGGKPINPLPYKDQVKLTCISYGPDNIDQDLNKKIEDLLQMPSGWLIYNTHGLDDEGWGPVSSVFLDNLLQKLTSIESVAVLPAGRALSTII
jgi:peptidoglycan/xylan/chitin deacetylase (PgdA/CDA1 family)